MTTTPTQTPSPKSDSESAPVSAPGPATRPASGASYPTTVATTAKRTLWQFFRTPQTLFMGTIQGAMFLFMFRYVFGYAISTRGGLSYVDWMVPGFLATVMFWAGMAASSGIAEDAAMGVYDRFRSLPIPRSAVMVGRSVADGGLVAWSIFTTTIIGFLIGFRTHGSLLGVLAGFVLLLVVGYCVTWVFIVLGLYAGNAQAAQGMGMLVMPFTFISSANVPVASMPGWMQPFAGNQPVSVLINAVRCLMQGGPQVVGIGHTTLYWVILTLIWFGGILVVFATLATRRFSRSL